MKLRDDVVGGQAIAGRLASSAGLLVIGLCSVEQTR